MVPTLAADQAIGNNSGTPVGSIVGGVIGAAGGVALIIAGLVWYKRRHRRKARARSSELYNDVFYRDPYQHNDDWMRTSLDEEEFYMTQRQSWWSSMSSAFQKSK